MTVFIGPLAVGLAPARAGAGSSIKRSRLKRTALVLALDFHRNIVVEVRVFPLRLSAR